MSKRSQVYGQGAEGGPIEKLPISGIIVGFNEGHLLAACLSTISFCDEIIYVDLGSNDNSVEIAGRFGAKLRSHPLVPSGEHALAPIHREATHDWILFIDPDEQLETQLQLEIRSVFPRVQSDPEVGSISAPWVFHFKQRRLYGTPWGSRRPRPFIAHRQRLMFLPETHRGRVLLEGFTNLHLDSKGSILHYWSESWGSLIRKHLRYLSTEGGSRFRRGDRISFGGVLARIPGLFWKTFMTYYSPQDGWNGIGLNLLWATYKSLALFALWNHSRLLNSRR